MDNIIAILDDTVPKSEIIRDVIGQKGFTDVVVKRRPLRTFFLETLQNVYPGAVCQVTYSIFDIQALLQRLEESNESIRVIHWFADCLIIEQKTVQLTLEKLAFIEDSYRMVDKHQQMVGIMFPGAAAYRRFLQKVCKVENSRQAARDIAETMPIDGIVDIGVVENFIQCVTGNFDSRYFNSLQGDNYTLVKSSKNKRKIKAEYTYYHLLPDDMKIWYVLPFDYQEHSDRSSYTMQRLQMTDLAIQWVHGSFNEVEFRQLMKMYFRFFADRHEKEVSQESYQKTAGELYVNKVVMRMEKLKTLPEYDVIAKFLEADTMEQSLDTIRDKYLSLKKRVEMRVTYPCRSVIGHGDPCFANALYNRSTRTLKFIDPKGALSEEELWTNPYYDIAKLSHSICGLYDFFNNGLYTVEVNQDFQYQLNLEFDNSGYKEIFKEFLTQYGYDYWSVRLYETSLFLSMLPLHIDNPHKVLGFILNAKNILKEIEENV